MEKYWITSDVFDNEVNINFVYDPFKIINDFVHYLSLEELEEFYEGISYKEYEYDFENEYVNFKKMGVLSDVTIMFPKEPKTERVNTDIVIASVGDYIEEYKKILEERNSKVI